MGQPGIAARALRDWATGDRPATINEFAPAKINLALHVLGRRADGYHELDSIVAFADVGDTLSFAAAAEFSLTASGPFAHRLPAPEHNIIFKAWKACAETFDLPPVAVSMVKNLPVSAGIGGGSANAAAAIRAFSQMAGVSMDIALALGADVPVCLLGRAARMQGIGEQIMPLENFTALPAVLVNPHIELSTAAVFQGLALARGEAHGSGLAGPSDWRNDLMAPAAALAGEITDVIAILQAQSGLRFARMSGSGATCFGVFESATAARRAAAAIVTVRRQWWVQQTTLR